MDDRLIADTFLAFPDAVLVATPDGSFLGCNRAAERELGLVRGRPIDQQLLLEPINQKHLVDCLAQTIGARQIVPARIEFTCPKGRSQAFVHLFPIRVGAAACVGLALVHDTPPGEALQALSAELRSAAVLASRERNRRRDAEARNHNLDQFAAIAAHDMKAPLRQIRAAIDLLKGTLPGDLDADSSELLELIALAADRSTRLISDLLKHAQMNVRAIVPEWLMLSRLVDEVVCVLRHDITEAGARVEVSRALPVVRADRTHLLQFFQNMIDNAIKYREPSRPLVVKVDARTTDEHVMISVADNGIGMEPELISRAFLPFKRLPEAPGEGSGIGLATCNAIAMRHGWPLSCESKPGAGACFMLQVPRSDCRPPATKQSAAG